MSARRISRRVKLKIIPPVFLLCLILVLQLCFIPPGYAQAEELNEDAVPEISLGEEYSAFSKGSAGEHAGGKAAARPLWKRVLWYLPNRVLDLLDVLHVDVGAGPALGAVGRLGSYVQAGARGIIPPGSVRVGLMGRRAPLMIETASEFGVSPVFVDSADRKVDTLEIGLSADVLLGASVGLNIGEIPDFFAGFVGADFSGDDH